MADDDYKTGYGKPPLATRFKKGSSGNPGGRPRRAKDIVTLLERQLDQLVTVTRNGRKVRIPMREYIVMNVIIAAAKGDSRAREFIFRHMRENGKPDPFGTNTADNKIWAEFAAAYSPTDDSSIVEAE